MNYRILIAEDDGDIANLLRLYLENEGFDVLVARDGQEGFELFDEEKIHLAIVDLMMPKVNGYRLVKKIRETSSIPILILSAKNTDNDKIMGLDLGADDYLTKPFHPEEVLARVRANLRRCYHYTMNQEQTEKLLRVGELELDKSNFMIRKNGKEIPLTLMEYKILACLMEEPGRIYTKVQILERINGEYYENDGNSLMVHISRIREKLEIDPKDPVYIKTVRGLGYKIEKI